MKNSTDTAEADKFILDRIASFTMSSVERQMALVDAVRYLVRRGVAGSFVECGVWRGGSTMAMLLALMDEGITDRDVFLYDTFEGMTAPTENDRTCDGTSAAVHLAQDVHRNGYWCVAQFDDVRSNVLGTGYPEGRIALVKGPVESTIPAMSPPEAIALLRLDTDWYASTKHELIHLFPKLSAGGILIVDDYGHWQGAKQAVDEFLAENDTPYYMHRIDYTGRLIIKL